MKNNAYFVSGTKQASSKIIDAWSEKLFLWLALHRARLLKDNKEPGVQHTNSPGCHRAGNMALGSLGEARAELVLPLLWPFWLLCLIKLNSPGQRFLTFNRSHKFYELVTHVISKLASGMSLL